MESKNVFRCSTCKKEKSAAEFRAKNDGARTKTCIGCLESMKNSEEKNKCPHKKRRSQCVACQGSGICEHKRQRSKCVACEGGSICEHKRQRSQCAACDPIGHLACVVRSRIYGALKGDKTEHSLEYLGCTIEEFKQHIEAQFKPGMSWENYGDWHVDHVVPLKYNNPTIDETVARLQYRNTQPLWATENIAKGNRFIG